MGKRIRLLSINLDLGMDLLLYMGLDLRLDHEHETQVLTLNHENYTLHLDQQALVLAVNKLLLGMDLDL